MMKKIDFIFHTRKGTLFNLTPLNQIELEIENVHLVMADFYGMHEVFEKLPNHLTAKKFMGLNNYKFYLSSIDSVTRRTRAIGDKEAVELNNYGYKKFSNKTYLEFFEMMKPERLVILSEEKIDAGGKGTKALKRTIDKSITFLKETYEYMQAESFKGDKNSRILAPVHGDEFMDVRRTNLSKLFHHLSKINGFVIYNFFRVETYAFRKHFYSL